MATAAKAASGSHGAWGQVIRPTGGGGTWPMAFNDTISGLYPNDISYWGAPTCVFITNAAETNPGATILRTTDGAEMWVELAAPSGPGRTLITIR